MKTDCCHPPKGSTRCPDCPYTVPAYSSERLLTAQPTGSPLHQYHDGEVTTYFREFPKHSGGSS